MKRELRETAQVSGTYGYVPQALYTRPQQRDHSRETRQRDLTVEAVVDIVDDVLGAWLQEDELAVVLFGGGRLLGGESALGVHVLLALVRNVRHNLARGARVHARQLRVHTDVGVVHVDGARTAQETHTRIVNVSIRSGGSQQRRRAKHLGDHLPAVALLRHHGRRTRSRRRGAHDGAGHEGLHSAERKDNREHVDLEQRTQGLPAVALLR